MVLNKLLKRRQLTFKNIIALLFCLIIIGEITLHFIPAKVSHIDFGLINDERIYTPTRSIKYKPNFARNWTGLGPMTIWHFNNLGFRDRSVETNTVPGNIFRIIFLGDSIAFGLGIEDYEALPRQIEKLLLPQEYNPKEYFFEVLNMAQLGFSA